MRIAIFFCLTLLVGCISYRPIEQVSGYKRDRTFYETAARQHCQRLIVGYKDKVFSLISVDASSYHVSDMTKRIVRVHLWRSDPMGTYSTKDYRWTDLYVALRPSGSLVSLRYEPSLGLDSMMAEVKELLSSEGQQSPREKRHLMRASGHVIAPQERNPGPIN